MKSLDMRRIVWLCCALVFSAFLSSCGKQPLDQVDASLPTLQVSNISVPEGDSGSTTATLIISLTKSSSYPVSITYATVDGTATATDDYNSQSGRLTFTPGETQKPLTIDIVGDTKYEQNETFSINFSEPQNVTINTAIVVVTINDDDTLATPSLQIGNVTIAEGNSGTITASFPVTLSEGGSGSVTVDYATADLTATAPGDYQAASGSLTFATGETSKTVTILVNGDGVPEIDETFKVVLSNPVNASLATREGVATITNDDTDTTVLLVNPGPQTFDEEQEYSLAITARASTRIFVSGMPPGMHWDEVNRRFDFRPDFIQGGRSWQVTMEAIDGTESSTETFTVTVNNTIQPPWPTITNRVDQSNIIKLTVSQTTDDFLDSPGHAGRQFTANLTIPTASGQENPLPLRIALHGRGGEPGTAGRTGFFGVAPHDPENTWWTGYNEQLPGSPVTTGTVPNYTQRRIMHLLSFLMENYPGVDPERVWVDGLSMGGTGSFFLSINYARHFSQVISGIGGTTPHLLSNGQQEQLTSFWGSVELGLPSDKGGNIWELYDSSRAALNDPDFRNLHFTTTSGQNDTTIPFTGMVGISPVTGKSFLSVLQEEGIGHFIVWDQRGHSYADKELGEVWWSPLDETSFLRRDLAFPAFTNCSADDNPGEPDGLGGFTGALRGALNRYLRWDSANIIDTRDRLEMPLRVDIDTTGTPPAAGYPPTGNGYFGPPPITTDVTIRRIQQFQTLPGEEINWTYNGVSGTIYANGDGSLTVRGLEITSSFVPLILTRP